MPALFTRRRCGRNATAVATIARVVLRRRHRIGVGDSRAAGGGDLADHRLRGRRRSGAAVDRGAHVVDHDLRAAPREFQCVTTAQAPPAPVTTTTRPSKPRFIVLCPAVPCRLRLSASARLSAAGTDHFHTGPYTRCDIAYDRRDKARDFGALTLR